MKKLFSILVFGLALSLFPLAASAIPAFPMNFTGTVSINGVDAPIGSVIKAYDSSDNLLAQFTLTTAGVYGNSDRTQPESAKLSIPEYTGDSLTFKINSPQYNNNAQLADTETYSGSFSEFTDKVQNLVFTGGTPTAVVSIAVAPATASVVAGSTQQFTATGTYVDASTADITSSCSWTSSDTSVATIGSSTGLATGVSAGTATITASYTDVDYGDLSDTATLTVTALPSGGGGGGGGDMSAPSISNITVSVASTTATISWTTSESSISWVVYGETTAYGSEEKITTYTKSHSVTLTGLSPATTYYYKVKSKDISGNIGTYTGKKFTTLTAEGEVVAPAEEEEEEVEKPISEMTIEELKAKIAEITNLIAQLQAELAKLVGAPVTIEGVPTGFTFDANLSVGSTGNAVKYLQIVLNSDVATQLAVSGVGSPGNETTYFGHLTKSAVIKFQEKYASDVLAPWGLTTGTGYVGKTTREKLNALLGQ